jgi:hypothetical protein
MEVICVTPDESDLDRGDPVRLTPEQRRLWHAAFPNGIDRSRLTADELELWDEWFPEGATTAFRLWEFGYACMLELSGPPAVLIEWMTALGFDPAWPLEYMENVRRKLEKERRERRINESS